MTSKILVTPIKYSVHREGDNPVFGESVTNVSVDDESFGPLIVIEQEGNKIKLDVDELEVIFKTAEKLADEYPKEYKGDKE